MDLCFELATQIMTSLGDVASPVDEVHGFRYFDDRDLMGFVDGTENPSGDLARDFLDAGTQYATSPPPNTSGCAARTCSVRVVPERGIPTMNTGREEVFAARRLRSDQCRSKNSMI